MELQDLIFSLLGISPALVQSWIRSSYFTGHSKETILSLSRDFRLWLLIIVETMRLLEVGINTSVYYKMAMSLRQPGWNVIVWISSVSHRLRFWVFVCQLVELFGEGLEPLGSRTYLVETGHVGWVLSMYTSLYLVLALLSLFHGLLWCEEPPPHAHTCSHCCKSARSSLSVKDWILLEPWTQINLSFCKSFLSSTLVAKTYENQVWFPTQPGHLSSAQITVRRSHSCAWRWQSTGVTSWGQRSHCFSSAHS